MFRLRTARKKTTLKRKITVGFAFFGVLLCLYTSVPVMAVTQNRLKSYLDGGGASWYDADFCSGDASATAATASGPAADLLQKAGLDGKWVDLIIKYAKQYKTDPIAMASLFFWENRKFPAYGEIRNGSASNGSGPWQFTSGSWNSKKYGSYDPNVYQPVPSTEAAAELVKAYGGSAGIPVGVIAQNFAKGSSIESMALVAKNYNAGQATWREPGIAKWNQQGRSWNQPAGNWGGTKERIIDDYVVGMTYLYYQIATGQKITYKDTNSYVQEALKKQDTLKNFKWTNSGSVSEADGKVTTTTTDTTNPIIVIDPGHSGKDKDIKDPQTGLRDHDYPNHPELEDMWDVSKLVESGLKAAGYSVVLTKKSAAETVTLRERANIANQNKAALAISLHDQAGKNGGLQFGKWAEIYPQRNGGYRENSAGKRVTFDNAEVAKKSEDYAKNFQETRKETEGITPTIKLNSFDGREGLDAGNLPLVQLFSNVPWVYMEAGGNSGGGVGLSDGDKKKYAEGIIEGVKKSVKAGTAVAGDSCSDVAAGGGGVDSIRDMALKLAWAAPYGINSSYDRENRRTSAATPKPEYVKAAKEYLGYSGSTIIDCGVFVSTVMHASGADPKFPKIGTSNMERHVRDPKNGYEIFNNIRKSSELKPGDILVVNAGDGSGPNGHIVLYTGKGGLNNKYDEASASLGKRAGNMGNVPGDLFDTYRNKHYTVARLKQ